MPLVSRTRATLRSAEFGFFGVCVNTRTHTPRFCGLLCSAGLFVLVRTASRPWRTNWLIVGIGSSHFARRLVLHRAVGASRETTHRTQRHRTVAWRCLSFQA